MKRGGDTFWLRAFMSPRVGHLSTQVQNVEVPRRGVARRRSATRSKSELLPRWETKGTPIRMTGGVGNHWDRRPVESLRSLSHFFVFSRLLALATSNEFCIYCERRKTNGRRGTEALLSRGRNTLTLILPFHKGGFRNNREAGPPRGPLLTPSSSPRVGFN